MVHFLIKVKIKIQKNFSVSNTGCFELVLESLGKIPLLQTWDDLGCFSFLY